MFETLSPLFLRMGVKMHYCWYFKNALKYTQVWSCFKENTQQIIAEVKTLQKMKV